MEYFEVLLQNRMLVETIYTFIIVFLTLSVYFKARKFYNLSLHNGFKYFGNAFLYFAIAYFIRFVIEALNKLSSDWISRIVLSVAFFYTVQLFGFYLVYSLVWKNIKPKEYLLHIIALIIALLSVFLRKPEFMFIIQLIVLSYAAIISYNNYKAGKKNQQLYFIAMILAFLGYLANFISGFITPFYPEFVVYVYAITISIFLVFYGIIGKRWLRKGKG